MVKVESGLDWKGEPCSFIMNEYLLANLEPVKKVVQNKDFDFVTLVAGLPGIGKSTFGINMAKYLDPNFTIDNIAFTAEDFIELTNTLPPRSAVILDESFESMNSKVGMSADFLKIMNHLQLIRQRNLFIILILPNFFDLQKSIAIYRSSFLFVCYGKKFGNRGSFAAFGREEKKMLYILGQKYLNYHATAPNFRGKFYKQQAINEDEYNKRKLEHLQNRAKDKTAKVGRADKTKVMLAAYMRHVLNISAKKMAEITGVSERAIHMFVKDGKESIYRRYKPLEYYDG